MAAADTLLITRIRQGDEEAWRELIGQYEGRLLAFVSRRLNDRTACEDVVQEALIGFLTSLPNYDESRPLESYLFTITAHKLTDHLRRTGRRPALPLSGGTTTDGNWEPPGRARGASSIVRSGERRNGESSILVGAIAMQLDRWRETGQWQKVACMEMLMVCGWANKDVATRLGLTEQQVANYKFDFLARIRTTVGKIKK